MFQRGHWLCPELSWKRVTSIEPGEVDTTPSPLLFSDLEQAPSHSVSNSSLKAGVKTDYPEAASELTVSDAVILGVAWCFCLTGGVD